MIVPRSYQHSSEWSPENHTWNINYSVFPLGWTKLCNMHWRSRNTYTSAGSDFTSQIFTEEFSRVDSVGVLKQGVLGAHTLHKKMKFSIKDFFSNWDQIRSFQIRKILNIKLHFLCSDTEYSWKGLETHLCCCKTTNKLSRCWID